MSYLKICKWFIQIHNLSEIKEFQLGKGTRREEALWVSVHITTTTIKPTKILHIKLPLSA